MKIKKIISENETKLIKKIKDDLGKDAIIISIKEVKKKNFIGFIKKTLVQATVAYDFEKEDKKIEKKDESKKNNKLIENENIDENKFKIDFTSKNINKYNNNIIEDTTLNLSNKLKVLNYKFPKENRVYENNILQLFYEELLFQGVLEEIAKEILDDALLVSSFKNIDINLVTKIVYNNIVNILNKSTAKIEHDKYNIVLFMGPTGVGKTTTIAKLSSKLIINENKSIGFITADTYRIAAVDQLKTYAEILDVDIEIVYEEDNMIKSINKLEKYCDLIFIDTAGRSHKNKENVLELENLTKNIKNIKKYLVISCTTKYEDIVSIIDIYSSKFDFDIIVTKLDETMTYGSIFNICYKFNTKISYITSGQNVPDDIEYMNSEKIAKILLGLECI